MKTLRVIALFGLILSSATAGILTVRDGYAEYFAPSSNPEDRLANIVASGSIFPFRKIGSEYYDLVPLFEFFEKKVVGVRPLPEWRVIVGTALQVAAGGGVLVSVTDGEFSNTTVFVQDAFVSDRLTDGAPVVFFAMRQGTHVYVNSLGANVTIAKFTFGSVVHDKKAEQMAASHLARQNQRFTAAEDAKAAAEAKAQEKRKKTEEAVRKFREEQAAKTALEFGGASGK